MSDRLTIYCDWPVCIGGECDYECEREDKYLESLEEEDDE
jgi:hypothetical protein